MKNRNRASTNRIPRQPYDFITEDHSNKLVLHFFSLEEWRYEKIELIHAQ